VGKRSATHGTKKHSISPTPRSGVLWFIDNSNCKLLAIYCNPDHIHILLGLRPKVQISELVKKIKVASSKFVKEKYNRYKYFSWQDGYAVFSYSYSQTRAVANYIFKQGEHHKKVVFKEEYMNMLEKAHIEFETEYLFDFF
jgi:hypothetical protein